MVLNFTGGKIVLTAHEIVVRLEGEHKVVLQAQADAVTLLGQGANVLLVNGSESKWSLKLDNADQIMAISQQLGCEIR